MRLAAVSRDFGLRELDLALAREVVLAQGDEGVALVCVLGDGELLGEYQAVFRIADALDADGFSQRRACAGAGNDGG